MGNEAWNVDLFSSELTSSLVSTLVGAPDSESLKRAVAESADAAEAVCRRRPMACRIGCPHCCVLNVSILPPEGMIIADWLRQQSPDRDHDAVRERIAAFRRRVRWMDDEDRIFEHVACPFLDAGGSCSIYPVRPLVCRGVASLDSDRCREAFRPMDAYAERLVPADLMRRAAFDAAFKSLAQALRHHGLDEHSTELAAGVLAFLDRPESLELLLSGERLPRNLLE